MHMTVVALRAAEAPRILDDSVVFTSDVKARSVGIAFEHEDFRTIHPMMRNQHGIYFLVFPIPPAKKEALRYRLVVDGVWLRDPLNPLAFRDPKTGLSVSLAEIPFVSDEKPGEYRILEGRRASFLYRSEPGDRVTLAGSFNDWDPFMYQMAEVEPGLYRFSLELPPGVQRYVFVSRGREVVDPLNPRSAYSGDGLRVSVLDVPD
jgi:hypothetical protein